MNTTKKLLIVSLLCLLLSGALAAYLWFYLEDRGSKLQEDLQTVHDKERLEREYKKLQSQLSATETDRALLERHIIAGENGTVSFLSLVDEIAAELGIELNTKELNVEKTDESGFDKLIVKFSLEGSEPQVERLLKMFETLPYQGDLTALDLRRTYNSENGSWSMNGDLTLELSTKEI